MRRIVATADIFAMTAMVLHAPALLRGGVTALACKKDHPVYIDELAEICDLISVSAGKRGLQILLAPEEYIRAVKPRVVAITKVETSSH